MDLYLHNSYIKWKNKHKKLHANRDIFDSLIKEGTLSGLFIKYRIRCNKTSEFLYRKLVFSLLICLGLILALKPFGG